jgi:hypothetical protein
MSRQKVYISTDSGDVILDLDEDLKLFKVLDQFYNKHKVSKSWIESGKYPVNFIKEIGYNEYNMFEKYVSDYRNSSKFSLLIKFLNKK